MPNESPNDMGSESALTESRVSELVNTAIAMREKRSEKRFSEMLDSKLAALAAPETKPEPSSPESSELKKIAQLERKLAEEVKLRRDATNRAATEKATGQLQAALTASGKLRPEAIPVAVELLTKAQGRLILDDNGSAQYRTEHETVSIEEGVQDFLASSIAALFSLPPVPKNSRTATRAPVTTYRAPQDDKSRALNDLIGGLPGLARD